VGLRLCVVAPGIENRSTCLFEVAGVARDDRQAVMKRRRGDDEIGLRIGVTGLASVRHQETPFEHYVLTHRENALLEHGPHVVTQPVTEFCTARWIGDAFDAEADFRKRDGADEEQIERFGCDEADDLRFRLWASQLGKNIRVEQPARQSLTPRTGSRSRFGSISTSR